MKNNNIIASWNKIEPSESACSRILSAVIEKNRSSNKRKDKRNAIQNTVKSIKKWAFPAICLVALAAAIGIAGKHLRQVNQVNNDYILPPARIGTTAVQASFGPKYTFEKAFSEADAVARVVVGNWLGEDKDLKKTYYEASVLQCFKGNLPKIITLLQDGCSTGTFKQYPLFIGGNELLVFINHASTTNYAAPYWIIGSFTTVLDVSYDKLGTRYYLDRYGILSETVEISTNYASQKNISEEISANLAGIDPIAEEMHYDYPYIFSEDDFLPLLSESDT